jgi:hypothetical protein
MQEAKRPACIDQVKVFLDRGMFRKLRTIPHNVRNRLLEVLPVAVQLQNMAEMLLATLDGAEMAIDKRIGIFEMVKHKLQHSGVAGRRPWSGKRVPG